MLSKATEFQEDVAVGNRGLMEWITASRGCGRPGAVLPIASANSLTAPVAPFNVVPRYFTVFP